MEKLLITGVSGLLGSNIFLSLSENYCLYGVYHRHALRADRVNCLQLDLTLTDQVEEAIKDIKPNWIIHCAALTDVDYCENKPAEAEMINILATRNVAKTAKSIGARLVYISTDSVFNGQQGNYLENDQVDPINIYARTKLEGEKIVQQVIPEALIIRTNIYGWNMEKKQSIAEWMLGNFEEGKRFNGFRDIFFSPILVNDLIGTMSRMMEMKLTGLYHIAGSQRCSKYDFGCMLAGVFGLDQGMIQPALHGNEGFRAPRPVDTSLNIQKISAALGMEMPKIVHGLERFKALRDSGYVQKLKELQAK